MLLFSPSETDYDPGPYQAQFDSGETSAGVLIRSSSDACAELQEDFILNLQLPAEVQNMNIHLGSLAQATVEITDPTGETTSRVLSHLRIFTITVHLYTRVPKYICIYVCPTIMQIYPGTTHAYVYTHNKIPHMYKYVCRRKSVLATAHLSVFYLIILSYPSHYAHLCAGCAS